MKTKKLALTLVLMMTAMGLSLWAEATPQMYTACGKNIRVREPKDSSGYFLDRDCQTVYVLPPRISSYSIDAYAPTTSEDICEFIQTERNVLLSQMKEIQREASKGEMKPAEKKSIERKIQRAETEKKKLDKQVAEVSQILVSLRSEESRLQESVTTAQSALDSCTGDCRLEEMTLTLSKDKLARFLSSKLNPAVAIENRLDAQVNQLQQEIENLESKLATADSSTFDPTLLVKLTALRDALLEHVKQYGTQEGGTMKVTFLNRHSELLQEFRLANPTLNVLRMPAELFLSFNIKVKGLMDTGSASLKIDIPGVIGKPLALKPGQNLESEDDAPEENDDSSKTIYFGDSISGQVVLSQLGACALTERQGRLQERSAGAHLVANAIYRYYTQVQRKFTASYNFGELFTRIEESKTSGGLFSSSAIHRLVKESDSHQWFNIEFESNDPATEFTDEVKVAQDLKGAMMDNALKQIAKAYVPYGTSLDMPNAPKTGAEVGSEALRKCPNLYCQVGAVLLDLGSALFGSKTQRDEFLMKNNYWQKEQFSSRKMVPRFSTFTFDWKN